MPSQRLELSEGEYLDIEETLSANARGRAFLRMRDQRSRLVGVAEVRRLVRDLKEMLPELTAGKDTREDGQVHILREELKEMSAYINQARREIAALRPTDGGANRIMAATGELDAIVSATERATSDILNGAERIQELASKLPRDGEAGAIAEEIQAQVTEVLTACSFQDITGQRTTKVVNALRYIEQRVNSMIGIWGVDETAPPLPANPLDTRPDAYLMNGPAADGGPSQDDVDALFEKLGDPAALSAATKPDASPLPPAAAKPGAPVSTQNEIDALFGAAQ